MPSGPPPPPYGPPVVGGQYQPPPYGWPAPPAPPAPARRRRTWLWITVAVVALLVVGGVVAAVVTTSGGGTKQSTTGRRLIVPQSSGPYSRLTSSEADRLATALQTQVSSGLNPARSLCSPSTASTVGTHRSCCIWGSMPTNFSLAASRCAGSWTACCSARHEDAEDVPAGALGGTFRCGVQRSFCAWSDDSTGGALFYYQAPPTGSLAATALQFRSDAEH